MSTPLLAKIFSHDGHLLVRGPVEADLGSGFDSWDGSPIRFAAQTCLRAAGTRRFPGLATYLLLSPLDDGVGDVVRLDWDLCPIDPSWTVTLEHSAAQLQDELAAILT